MDAHGHIPRPTLCKAFFIPLLLCRLCVALCPCQAQSAELQTLDGNKPMQVEIKNETDTHITFVAKMAGASMQMKMAKKQIWRVRDDANAEWRQITAKKARPKPKKPKFISHTKRMQKQQQKKRTAMATTGKEPVGMPCWRGWRGDGFGSGNVELVESLSEGKILWTSEAEVAGTWRDNYICGYHGAIFADGRVFFNYYMGDDNRVKPQTPEADDIMLCADLATGKTLWQAKSPGGADLSPMHRIGPYSPPCYADGRVFFQGSTGRIFALDATTGKLLWKYTEGGYTKRCEEALANCIKEKKGFNIGGCCMHAIHVAQNVLVGAGCGFDPATGRVLWGPVRHMRKNPIRWVHRGRAYIISGNSCIDPRTGKLMWSFGGRTGEQSDVVCEDYLVTNGKAPRPDKGSPGEGMIGYRITPKGATKLWQLPPKYHGSRGVSKVIHNNHLYATVPPNKSRQPRSWLFSVDLATGKVVSEIENGGARYPSMVGCGDYILAGNMDYFKADPKELKILSTGWQGGRLATCTTHAFGAGFLVLRGSGRGRGRKSHLYCVDMRKNPTPLTPIPPVATKPEMKSDPDSKGGPPG